MNTRRNIRRNNITKRIRGRNPRIRAPNNRNNPNIIRSNRSRFNRFNNNRRNFNNKSNQDNNRNSNNNKKMNNKINKLVKDFNNLNLRLFPKIINNDIGSKKVNNKEPRIDKLLTPMNMVRTTKYVSIHPTLSRFKYMPIYTKFQITTRTDGSVHVIVFPYFTAFTSYDSSSFGQITVNNNSIVDTATNIIASYIPDSNPQSNGTLSPRVVGKCGIYGTYRVVGMSIKITNLTAYNSRSGAYTIYKLNDTPFHPMLYSSEVDPTAASLDASLRQAWINVLITPKDTISVKRTFAANDIGMVNEYNMYEGNDIFQKPTEYLGGSFTDSVYPIAHWDNNPTGVNVVYDIDFGKVGTSNNYLIETWQVIEVIPDPLSHLDTLAETQKYVYNKAVLEKIKHMDPISKSL